MIMPPALRKLALSLHVTASVGLIGAVAGFLALGISGLASAHPAIVGAAYPAMALTAWFVIGPLAFASLLTGIVQSLGTSWGLVRHYWVVAKLLLTLFVTAVLLLQLKLIDGVATAAIEMPLSAGDLLEARMSLVVHSGGGLLVLLLPVALSVYKPRGRTLYGIRKQAGAIAQAK
jgi:hypothetical protein